MGRRAWLLVSLLLALCVSAAGVALAQSVPDGEAAKLEGEGAVDSALEAQRAAHPDEDHQHGGSDGHLPPRRQNVKVIGKAEAEGVVEGRIADVNYFGNHAYLAAFNEPECQDGGVYVFDIKNLKEPRQVGFIPAAEGSFVGEGVQVTEIDTPRFEGDVLIHNNEICDAEAPQANGGVSLFDVSNPKKPKALAEGVGDEDPEAAAGTGAHQVHSAFAWDAGRKAYAVIVDDEEAADIDILDITDPRKPRVIAEYDLNERFPQIVQEDLGTAESFFHDVIVKKIDGRQVMLASYWDGGYVKLDVTDPKNAKYLADSDFNNPDPEARESRITVPPEGNAHRSEFSLKNNFIVAADEDFSPYSVVATNTTDGAEFDATQGSDTLQIDDERSLEGQTVFAGLACPGGEAVPAGDAAAPAPATIEVGTTGDSVNVEAVFDGWGYVHLFRNGEGKLRELDTYAIPEAHDERFAEGFGNLSVHEVAMSEERNNLAHFSYYSGGFRVAKIQNGNLREVGSYIARGGNNFWGVQVIERNGKEYVLASDRDFGLYVFEYTGRP